MLFAQMDQGKFTKFKFFKLALCICMLFVRYGIFFKLFLTFSITKMKWEATCSVGLPWGLGRIARSMVWFNCLVYTMQNGSLSVDQLLMEFYANSTWLRISSHHPNSLSWGTKSCYWGCNWPPQFVCWFEGGRLNTCVIQFVSITTIRAKNDLETSHLDSMWDF